MCQVYRFDKLGFVDLISTNFYKVEVDCRLVFIIKLPIAAPKCLISDGDWLVRLASQAVPSLL